MISCGMSLLCLVSFMHPNVFKVFPCNHSFSGPNNIAVTDIYNPVFIHLSVNGRLCCLLVLNIINDAVMNTFAQVLVWMYF